MTRPEVRSFPRPLMSRPWLIAIGMAAIVGIAAFLFSTRKTSPEQKSEPLAVLASKIEIAVNRALAGEPISGYQPIPSGSKLLSARVAIEGDTLKVTLDFNRAIMTDGMAEFEDTFTLVSNTVQNVLDAEGRDINYQTLEYVTLIEGQPIEEILNAMGEMTQNSNLKFPGVLPAAEIENKLATIKTPKGEIRFELLPAEAPKATSNFVYLAKQGYFDGLNFHRVESWVVQGGDPNCTPGRDAGQCGAGGPGYRFEDEPVRLPYTTGIVAMANAGANTNGSQFFILKQDTRLDPAYTIFGRVIAGQGVVDQIAAGDVMERVEIVAE